MLQLRTIGGSIYRVSAGAGGRVWGGSAEAEGERFNPSFERNVLVLKMGPEL